MKTTIIFKIMILQFFSILIDSSSVSAEVKYFRCPESKYAKKNVRPIFFEGIRIYKKTEIYCNWNSKKGHEEYRVDVGTSKNCKVKDRHKVSLYDMIPASNKQKEWLKDPDNEVYYRPEWRDLIITCED